MQIRSFKAQGFKNFRKPVVLEDIGPINVIHGPNNVGKSNLLEAMRLFFVVLGNFAPIQMLGGRLMYGTGSVPDRTLREHGFNPPDLFNLEFPAPIWLEATLVTTPEDLRKRGIDPAYLALDRVTITIELYRSEDNVVHRIRHFVTADGKDQLSDVPSQDVNAVLATYAKIAATLARVVTAPTWRFVEIPVTRLGAPELALALYDAKESPDLSLAHRWERFVEVTSSFKDILGEGKLVVTYDRNANQATVMLETARARIPLRLLGSGAQQVVALLGTILVSNGGIVCIEEPELNLRYTVQLRMREALGKIVGGPGGLDQIFITSHSDAFESGTSFYLMRPTSEGPEIERCSVAEARAALGITSGEEPLKQGGVLCYLSTEGVVRVPERICRVIGLPQGGGVVFLEREGASTEMMSDATFAERFEPKQQDEGDDDA